ncbi:MAG: GIY-YIG nuclease family protein [Clostridia bacterium]|nr:GIY-YIG nuclease family protein [Clostridia bacterium]
MTKQFFTQRPEVNPTIYVYKLVGVQSHEGYIKVGYTDRSAEIRIEEQIGAVHVPHQILHQESAMRKDGISFTDKSVHRILRRKGFKNLPIDKKNEWFKCTVQDVIVAIRELKTGIRLDERTETFSMRPEQYRAVEQTINYFKMAKREFPDRTPKFLWNAKMRFGKTFAAYQLAKKMGFTKILVLTFKPAVESAWSDDLLSHVDFEGWQFISNKDAHNSGKTMDQIFAATDFHKPLVVFGSFQDLLGTNDNGGIKAKNEFIHLVNWDLVIFDEYHFGAWRENAKKLFEDMDEESDADFDAEAYKKNEADNAYNETFLPITAFHYLFLSGTPFRAINSGEFIEEQIYNWTYSDEQRAKEEWIGSGNPYEALPRMVMLTYRIPDSIRHIAMQGEFNEFDLNVFFSAKGKGKDATFVYKNEVQRWLDLIRGAYMPGAVDELKLGSNRPPMPYNDARLLSVLTHTLWFLPNVASCQAMANLLSERQNTFYHDYKIVVCAGTSAGIGLDALEPVQKAMADPLESKTITLSCGKLTTGVTVRPWTGVFMLRNLKSPETYFQTAFRVQSPWEYTNSHGEREILKRECYIFDFALDRALRQISDYSCSLDVNESNPEKKVADFIRFLPVLAYDGSKMTEISAQDVLDIALAGTSATLLARRWESALLVNVDNDTLKKLMDNPDAMAALMSIEGFRSLNKDIETIINKSEAVKKAKKEREKKLTPEEKKELTDEEKKAKSMRKQIQEKLIKFATRIPIFMYLTDFRERSLHDVITQLEPGLFKNVTGLSVTDFELLCSLNLFNPTRMNDAIFKFKRYEDASLSYTGIDKHRDEAVGGWDTVIRREEYDRLFASQQETLTSGLRTTSGGEPIVAVPVSTEPKPEQSTEKGRTKKGTTDIGTQPAQEPTPKQSETKPDQSVAPSPEGIHIVIEKPQPTEIPDPGVTKGMFVTHKKFGRGKVTYIDKPKNYIYVKFDSIGGKMFKYLEAFRDGFLTKG